jgi:hypothetical protein
MLWAKPDGRMWMNDPDGDGWGSPTAESPISILRLNIVIMWVKILIISCRNTELCETSYKTMDSRI